MAFNRFFRFVILQAVLLAVTGTFFLWTLMQDYLLFTKFTIGFIWLLQIILLIHYLTRTNRGLNNFLQSVKHLDPARGVTEGDKSFDLLNLTYNEIIDSIQKVKIEKEAEHHFFQNTIEHVDIGLISFNEEGYTELFNRAAREMFKVEFVRNIQELNKSIPGISEQLFSLKQRHSKMIKAVSGDEILKLSIRKTVFKIQDNTVNLVSLQNIRTELEEEEIEVWKKLISVLTHEIMNSVAPIKSLTNTMIKMFEKKRSSLANNESENVEDTLLALKAIQKRSKGLMSFVEIYRNLTKVPKPVFEEIELKSFLNEIIILMDSELQLYNIVLSAEVRPENLKLSADEKLITQVIINLIKNSVDSTDNNKNGKIQIKAFISPQFETVIQVTDNGTGIPTDLIDKVFIPFFTTKEHGSGIGLSLSRQIMKLHGGTISVFSKPGIETAFSLIF
jgi:Signal transduction histidine kinase involved in nitrogen fixation and metabolism regulation